MIDITDRKRMQTAQQRLNRELRAFINCNHVLVRAEVEQSLLEEICRIICDEAGYRMAWVGFAENDHAKSIRPVAWAGVETGYLKQAQLTWADTERGLDPGGIAIRTGKSFCIQDFTTESKAILWRENALQQGYRSGIALPLKDESARTFGVLTIYSTESDVFTGDEIRLLEELSGDLAFGITTLRIRLQRKQAEETLQESERRYREIFENTSETINIYSVTEDHRFQLIDSNPATEILTRVPRSLLIGQFYDELPSNESVQVLLEHFRECLEKGTTISHEQEFSVGGHSWVVFDTHIPVRDATGRIYRIVSIGLNITERKKAEEEIRKLNQELEKRVIERTSQLELANKELESFAYSVSHDLRAPLRGIDGFSQILLEEYQNQVDEKGKNYLLRIRQVTQRMAQLIDDMLNFSRVSGHEISMKQVHLSEMVKEITDGLREAQPERQVEFIIQNDIKIQGDAVLMRTVLENLLGNAWKFTSKHSTACIEFGMQQQKEIPVYYVRDDGAGFDMSYASKLFGAFQRLHTNEEFSGTGIGLATVQRIIDRHGGKVWAEGEVENLADGKPGGATFYFTIPKQ